MAWQTLALYLFFSCYGSAWSGIPLPGHRFNLSGCAPELFKPRVYSNFTTQKSSLFEFRKWDKWQELGFFHRVIPNFACFLVATPLAAMIIDIQVPNFPILPIAFGVIRVFILGFLFNSFRTFFQNMFFRFLRLLFGGGTFSLSLLRIFGFFFFGISEDSSSSSAFASSPLSPLAATTAGTYCSWSGKAFVGAMLFFRDSRTLISVTKSLYVNSNFDQQCKFMVRQKDSYSICRFTLLNVSPKSYNTSQLPNTPCFKARPR